VPERILALSESFDPQVRSTAAWAMGRIGDPAFISRLTVLLRDENPRVRSTAVRSLIEIGRAEKRRIAASVPEPVAAEPVPAQLPAEAFELMLDGSSFRSRKRA
jgi:HEAT repeat protein